MGDGGMSDARRAVSGVGGGYLLSRHFEASILNFSRYFEGSINCLCREG